MSVRYSRPFCLRSSLSWGDNGRSVNLLEVRCELDLDEKKEQKREWRDFEWCCCLVIKRRGWEKKQILDVSIYAFWDV